MEYSKKVLEHFNCPKNVGFIQNANGVGEVGSKECGDYLVVYLKINNKTKLIEDAKFHLRGCVAAIASSSAATELVKGINYMEAVKITEQDIVGYLDGLPEEKIHCSVMGAEAVKKAVLNYLNNKPSWL